MSVSTDPATQVFLLPDLGEGLAEAEVVEWKVALGDTVVIDQVVVEVETAKAVVEVPSPYAGMVEALHGAAGATVIVGSPLITIAVTAGAAVPSAPGAPPSHEQHREEERAGSGNVLIGYGTSETSTRRRRRVRPGAAGPDPSLVTAAPSAPTPASAPAPTFRVLSPVVRKLARDNDIDISTLAASGLGGVIRRCDVEAAISADAPRNVADAPGDAKPAPIERILLTGFRKAVADKLSTSRREIPDATTWVDVDATELMNARRAINSTSDEPASLLALLARLCIAGLVQFPELNSTVDTGRQEILRYRDVNLGIAAQTPRGLVVPVIDAANTLTTAELSAALREATTLARDGKLAPGRLAGGTFTLNNYGVFGVDGSTPIINHPEAAILGIGRIVDRPWVLNGQVVARKVTQLSLTFDHRVCDGGVAGGFLRLFADYVENPVAALAHI